MNSGSLDPVACTSAISTREAATAGRWRRCIPDTRRRLAFSALLAGLAALIVLTGFALDPNQHSDLGLLWSANRLLLDGHNPYPLIGPARSIPWPWYLTYPGTALIATLPLAVIPSEAWATAIFSALTSFALAWGATRDGWHRLPAFASLPFVVAVAAGQWSMLMASTLFLPTAAALWCVKPTMAVAIAAGERKLRPLVIGIIGAVVLVTISVALIPSWPQEWFSIVSKSHAFKAPITYPGGFAVAAVLMRWRRPDALLLFLMACVPQSPGIYDLLILLVAIPRNLRESCVLSLMTTAGAFLLSFVPYDDVAMWMTLRGMLMVATCYLPATVMVLRRENRNDPLVPEAARST